MVNRGPTKEIVNPSKKISSARPEVEQMQFYFFKNRLTKIGIRIVLTKCANIDLTAYEH